eukprot:jgi/Chlat1/6465/Chrsp45S05966
MDSPDSPVKRKSSKAGDKLKQKSPAEFFAENKNIAGFDNPGKSLYTTIRELVENSLDAAEAAGELPEIELTIEEITKQNFNKLIGLVHRERVDAKLYHDYETEKEREKRVAKETKEREKLAKAANGISSIPTAETSGADITTKAEQQSTKPAPGRPRLTEGVYYRVTCKDNGMGMAHGDIPNMLGRVLSGTKYGIKQTRGKFGLGAKMALIWSKMSTGLPIEIWSAKKNQDYISYFKLDIDIHKNTPNIHAQEKAPNAVKWRGSELRVIIEGNWSSYRAKIVQYMRQLAIITPYAHFTFQFVTDADDKNISVHFNRRTDVMPRPPMQTKYHPSAIDLLLLKHLISETNKSTLVQFFSHEFSNISKGLATRLVGELGADFKEKMSPKSLTDKQLVRIHQLFRQAKFPAPDGDVLSPAGEYNLRLGIMKELCPDMVATYEGSTQVFEGHPFIVEAGVSLGGKDVKQGINVFRFANRIPLLFEPGGDVVTRTATKRILWASYKINQATDRIGVFVSIVSTKIPFKGTGKEYIGDDISEIASAVKFAIQQCCVQLKSKLVKQQQARERQQRKRNLTKYIPDVARAIFTILEDMAQDNAAEAKRRRLELPEKSREIMTQVHSNELTETLLVQKLEQHVDQVDAEMAFEYAMQTGNVDAARQALYLSAMQTNDVFRTELHHPLCVFKILHEA